VIRADRVALCAVLIAYLALGSQYALLTPAWQVPDEPAHYNYIAQVAADPAHPPRLGEGDYPLAYLEALKAEGFHGSGSLAAIAYEDYQPPAYYYLAAVPFRLSPPDPIARLHAVRLLGVLLGAVTVVLSWLAARLARPGDRHLAVAAAAFVAFLPMHLAMTAGANNDPLAYALATAILVVSLARLGGRLDRRRFVVVGAGLYWAALLAKVSVYPAAILLVAADLLAPLGAGGAGGARRLARALWPPALGLLAALPWFARNMRLYGLSDPLGTRAHDRLVVGQPRTAAWIAEHGLAAWLQRFAVFTFESFWGVFGWLGVFLDRRMYAGLALATAIAAVGLVGHVAGERRAIDRQAGTRRRALALVGLSVGAAAGLYLAYNVGFVQHQGRYLFTALAPIALLFGLGWRHAAEHLARCLGFGRRARALGNAALYAFVVGLAILAWLALNRYVLPALT
jgi:hypothetical protein